MFLMVIWKEMSSWDKKMKGLSVYYFVEVTFCIVQADTLIGWLLSPIFITELFKRLLVECEKS